MHQRRPQSDRGHKTRKHLQIAVAGEQQRSQSSVVIGVREPDHAILGPELGVENGVGTAQDEQCDRPRDREHPKHGVRQQRSRLFGRRLPDLYLCKCHEISGGIFYAKGVSRQHFCARRTICPRRNPEQRSTEARIQGFSANLTASADCTSITSGWTETQSNGMTSKRRWVIAGRAPRRQWFSSGSK